MHSVHSVSLRVTPCRSVSLYVNSCQSLSIHINPCHSMSLRVIHVVLCHPVSPRATPSNPCHSASLRVASCRSAALQVAPCRSVRSMSPHPLCTSHVALCHSTSLYVAPSTPCRWVSLHAAPWCSTLSVPLPVVGVNTNFRCAVRAASTGAPPQLYVLSNVFRGNPLVSNGDARE